MKKTLKSIQKKHGMLNEAYAWERTSGGALPTLADVQAKYNAKSVNEQGVTSAAGTVMDKLGASGDEVKNPQGNEMLSLMDIEEGFPQRNVSFVQRHHDNTLRIKMIDGTIYEGKIKTLMD